MCNEANGTHRCQNPTTGHEGRHYAYYVDKAGKLRLVLWQDRWGILQGRAVPITLPVVK